MDERARHATVLAMQARRATANSLPLISATNSRALQLLLATEANDARLTPLQRQNAQQLQQYYHQQYVNTCLHRHDISGTQTNQRGKDKTVAVGTEQPRKSTSIGSPGDASSSGGGSIVERVRARVDRTLENKRAARGFVSAIGSRSNSDMSDYTMCITDLTALTCEPELDLLPVPESLTTLREKFDYHREQAAWEEAQEAERIAAAEEATKVAKAAEAIQAQKSKAHQDVVMEDVSAASSPRSADSPKQHPSPGPASSSVAKPVENEDPRDDRNQQSIVMNAQAPAPPQPYPIPQQQQQQLQQQRLQQQQQQQQQTQQQQQQHAGWSKYAAYHDEDDEDYRSDPVPVPDYRPAHNFSNGLDRTTKKRVRNDRTDGSNESVAKPMQFITAKEQMVIEEQQQEEKRSNHYLNRSGYNAPTLTPYNNNGNSNSSNNYGNGNAATQGAAATLKSKILGTKRAKFKSPINRSGSNENNDEIAKTGQSKSANKTDEPVDERLRNIDPKMIEAINNEIMESLPVVSWEDISGLEHAKKTIKETITWPMLRPDIFTGLRRPPKGLLLFGPPGTGKTMIGKCIASQSKATFFSISSSSLTSKWVGDGEKMVRALFAVARCHQPAVIFMDEIDSLLTQRSDGEVEASRRIKTEFLVQFDGVGVGGEEDRILIVGATNRPQEIDEAARRRFQKRLYIPLPESQGRYGLMMRLLEKQAHELTQEQILDICERTAGYSGSDMTGLCREAALGPVRAIQGDILEIGLDSLRAINHGDFVEALSQVRASVSDRDLDLYKEWDKEYGSMAKG
ncbi:hypothetical protein EDD11_007252 [Mortierella claussenii]|nr:hypothetical protein EDD11_007252 [Mortierella claussenii]